MSRKKVKITNPGGETLDALIEGKQEAPETLVFVHGFGTDKNEGYNIFADWSKELKDNFTVVRFDFSGYGASDGKQVEVDYQKHSRDLASVLNWARANLNERVSLIAHSMGCFITSLLSPDNIRKSVFSGIPNADTNYIADRIQEVIRRRGGVVDENGVSEYPRSSGENQKMGASFWKVLRTFDPIDKITEYANKTDLLILHPREDDVIGDQHLEPYQEIEQATYLETPGDHNYSQADDRAAALNTIRNFLADKLEL